VLRASAAAPLFTGFIFATSILAYGLTGCGANSPVLPSNPSSTTPYSGAALSGHAISGSQPLIGAAIQLYAAGTSGDGSAASSLLSLPLTTDSAGAFTVPAGYSCPTAASQLYLVARGGKAGNAASTNSAIAMLAPLGACSSIASAAKFTINEVTTAAGAYALAQFLSPGGNIGATSTNSTGIANAFAKAATLADISLGASPGPAFPANGSSPAPTLNAVANILNACAVAAPSTSACTDLFSATTVSGSAAPANLLDAALNLVRHPAANAAALYSLSTASAAFAPAIKGPPTDWTVSVNFTGGGMNTPTGLGIDSAGNVWVANYNNVASEFTNTGVPMYANGLTGSGLNASYGLAVDSNNNAWIPNEPAGGNGGSITVFNSSGQPISGSGGFTAGGLDYPVAIAIDTDGSAWIADYANSHLTHLSSSGAALSGPSGYTDNSIALPVSIAVDASHNVWLGNSTGSSVVKVSGNGTQFTAYTCCDESAALAFDQQSNLWIASYYTDSISEISSSGVVVSAGAYTGGGLYHPQAVAVDGSGNVWIANRLSKALTELAGASASSPGTALSPSGGIGGAANLVDAFALAIDSSGDMWVTNSGSNILTEYIGLASPVKTPLIGLPAAP
jgi:hypothetical protein